MGRGDNMSFEIMKNSLNRNSEIKSLKLQNNNYKITFFYYGDYEKDAKNKEINIDNVTMSCKEKGELFSLTMSKGRIFISVPQNDMLSIKEVDDFEKNLQETKETAVELEEIIKEHFCNKER